MSDCKQTATDVDGLPIQAGDEVCYMGGSPFTVERVVGNMLVCGRREFLASLCHRPDGRASRDVWKQYMEGGEE
jgi:hypothetical protein